MSREYSEYEKYVNNYILGAVALGTTGYFARKHWVKKPVIPNRLAIFNCATILTSISYVALINNYPPDVLTSRSMLNK